MRSSKTRTRREGWFFAELIQECRVAGAKASLVWVNMHLIRAVTAEQAYRKAVALGRKHNQSYLNDAGEKVVWRFRGLRELATVHDAVSDGVEIYFETHRGVNAKQLSRMIRTKSQLSEFRK